jgi:AraC-like DNA-binding protein
VRLRGRKSAYTFGLAIKYKKLYKPNTTIMLKLLPPHKILAPFVACFSINQNNFDSKIVVPFSARGIPMLIFPFNKPSKTTFRHGGDGKMYPKPMLDEAGLLTCNSVYNLCSFEGEVNMLMAILKPTAAHYLLQGSVNGLSNSAYLLDDLGLKRHFQDLQDQLWEVQTASAAIQLVQPYLIRYFTQQKPYTKGDFSPVLAHILRYPGALHVSDLAKKFKCSDRWIEKQCAHQTGLSPKLWLQLVRFRSVCGYRLSHPTTTWMEIVDRFNYTDQSHLIKDFQRFTGSSPVQHFEINDEDFIRVHGEVLFNKGMEVN